MLQDRHSECGRLDHLLEGLRVGRSGALVLRGEPGIGKSALLEYLTEHASGCRVPGGAGGGRGVGDGARVRRAASAVCDSRSVLSQPSETMRRPSGLNATLSTAPVWPVSDLALCWRARAEPTVCRCDQRDERESYLGHPTVS